MNGWPIITADGRGRRLTVVALLSLLQALAAGSSAMALRESFAVLAMDQQHTAHLFLSSP